MNKNYNKGRRFEYAIMKDLKKDAILTTRTAGSHSKIDVISIQPNKIILIQAKTQKKNKDYAKEIFELHDLVKKMSPEIKKITEVYLFIKKDREKTVKIRIGHKKPIKKRKV